MSHRTFQTPIALCAVLLTGAALPAMAQGTPGQIRTVDIPPSDPVTADGFALELPSVEEAQAIDAADPVEPSAAPVPASVTVDRATAAADAAARAIAEAEAARLRAANDAQLSVARRQLDDIRAQKQAERDRLARYREAQAAHAAAMADYDAQLAASRDARRRWEADVTACQSGDWSRCATPAGPTQQQ